MSIENIGLSEKQRRIVNENIKGLCRPASCDAPSLGCPIGELIGNDLPLCYAKKSKKDSLVEGVKAKKSPETEVILEFLAGADVVTKEKLDDLQSSQLSIRQIMERRAQETKDSRP